MTDTSFLHWSFPPLTLILLALFAWLYVRGWLRMQKVLPTLASGQRLAAMVVGIGLLLIVTISPLNALSQYYLVARSMQKVLICMIAAPFLLLACPVHIIAWSLPSGARRSITRLFLRPSAIRSALKVATQSGVSWLVYLAVFLIWHEPDFADWSNQRTWTQAFAIWTLFYASLLFWWHVTHTGLRIHRELPGWITIAYLLGVEIPNMFTGVSIAFTGTPIYTYYAEVQAALPNVNRELLQLTTIEDQMIGGGLTWVLGSMVYVSSIVLVLNKLFRRERQLPPVLSLSTEPTHRTIAPGLEHRVTQSKWRQLGDEGTGSN